MVHDDSWAGRRSYLEKETAMDVSDLVVFEAVSRHGSMNRAASELNTVQSNVTARIRALEGDLGVSLFQRHARGVSITPSGQRIQPLVARLTKLLADVRTAARDDGAPHGMLHLGSLETTTALRLSAPLTQFAQIHPEVRLIITTGTTRKLLDDVINCRLEGAFVAGPAAHPDLHQEKVFTEELVLVTSRHLSRPDELKDIAELRTIVFQAGCSYRQRLDSLLSPWGPSLPSHWNLARSKPSSAASPPASASPCCPKGSSDRPGKMAGLPFMSCRMTKAMWIRCLFVATTLSSPAR